MLLYRSQGNCITIRQKIKGKSDPEEYNHQIKDLNEARLAD